MGSFMNGSFRLLFRAIGNRKRKLHIRLYTNTCYGIASHRISKGKAVLLSFALLLSFAFAVAIRQGKARYGPVVR